jgi:hypothetical protein
MTKRTSYSHELEVRAVVWRALNILAPTSEPIPEGVVIGVEPVALINEVYIAPNAGPMLVEVVQTLLDQAGLKLEVKQSGVNAPPPY